MNPKITTDSFSLDSTDIESQQYMSDRPLGSSEKHRVAETYCLELGDEYLPKGQITAHPFSLTSKELSGLLKNKKNTKTPQIILHKESRVSTDYSIEKFHNKPVGGSEYQNQSKSSGLLNNGQPKTKKSDTPQTILHKESRVSTDYSIEKFHNKPVGGSGWLHKYTKLTETKTGLVEYPRVKEGQRSTDDPTNWYWNYCWHKKGKNGKPLYKKGKAVVSSVGCPQKKVRVVERAIAAKLPHRQILELIKGYNSTPPPT